MLAAENKWHTLSPGSMFSSDSSCTSPIFPGRLNLHEFLRASKDSASEPHLAQDRVDSLSLADQFGSMSLSQRQPSPPTSRPGLPPGFDLDTIAIPLTSKQTFSPSCWGPLKFGACSLPLDYNAPKTASIASSCSSVSADDLPLLTELVDSNRAQAEALFEKLAECKRTADVNMAKQLLHEAPCAVEPRMVNAVIGVMHAAGQRPQAVADYMLTTCSQYNIQPTQNMMNNVLGGFARSGTPHQVLDWLRRMEAFGVPRDTIACNTQLRALVSLKDMASAESLLRMMDGRHGLPRADAVSFNTLLSGYAHAMQPERVHALVRQMRECGLAPNIKTYTTLISSYARTSQPLKAHGVLEEMVLAGIVPDLVAFNTLLSAHAKMADSSAAHALVGQMTALGVEPDVVTFNTLISACARAHQPEQAHRALEEMQRRHLTPDHLSFSGVVHAYTLVGNRHAAEGLLRQMRSAGIGADAVAYNSLMAMHARAGDANAAIDCCTRMCQAGIQPTGTSMSILVNSLVRSGKVDAARSCIEEASNAGVSLPASCFNSLISAYGKARRTEEATQMLTWMQESGTQPSLVSYNAVAAAWASRGNLTQTERAIESARAAGFTPDRYSYGALLQACERCGTVADSPRAIGLVAELLHSQLELNDVLTTRCQRLVGHAAFSMLYQASHRHAAAMGGIER